MTDIQPLESLAVRLADEGVPLRAIARATHTPSDILRARLIAAKNSGTLIELPKEDWPPGFPRDERALQLSRMLATDREAMSLAIQRIFHLTATEVSLLMLLLQSTSVPKSRINLGPRCIDVHIYNIRKRLAPFNVLIQTLWGYGYQLSSESRQRTMALILEEQPA